MLKFLRPFRNKDMTAFVYNKKESVLRSFFFRVNAISTKIISSIQSAFYCYWLRVFHSLSIIIIGIPVVVVAQETISNLEWIIF